MRTLIENWPYKLFAAAAAFGLWFWLAGEAELATSVPVSVQYRNVPADLELSSEHPDRLFLRLRGPSSRLRAEELARIAIQLDLAKVQAAGEQTVTIGRDTLSLPKGVTLLRVVPSQMRLRFERRVSKEVAVEPRFTGPAHKGYRITDQSVHPQKLRIVGPESRMKEVVSVQTDPIDLSSTVSSAEFHVSAYTPDGNVRFEETPATVTVKLKLEKIPQTQYIDP